jgi:hypothetical protein
MKALVIRYVNDQHLSEEFEIENLISEMERRGFKLSGRTGADASLSELRNQPQFSGFMGPMANKGDLRYEDHATFNHLST